MLCILLGHLWANEILRAINSGDSSDQGSYKKLNVKIRNIQEYFLGKL